MEKEKEKERGRREREGREREGREREGEKRERERASIIHLYTLGSPALLSRDICNLDETEDWRLREPVESAGTNKRIT